jgi:hypothetical protein
MAWQVIIHCCYYCRKCGNDWYVNWHKKPWFLDYTRKCRKCGRSVWPTSITDESRNIQDKWQAARDSVDD